MLEECALAYKVRWINLGEGEQFQQDYLAISPNGKIPAIVDHQPPGGREPLPIFESGAILVYLAEKTGKFLGHNVRERKAVLEWLFWQVGGFGPMLGQYGHFKLYAPARIEYAIERYRREAQRLYHVLDNHLSSCSYLAGDEYSIADMAIFPWVRTWKAQGIDLAKFPSVREWYDRLKGRPALRRGIELGRERIESRPPADAKAKSNL